MPPKNPGDRSWKAAAQEWLFAQGVSTVLLFTILAGLAYGAAQSRNYITLILNAHHDGLRVVAEENRKAVVSVGEEFSKVHDRDQKTIERQEQLIDRLMDRLGQDVAAQGNSSRHNQSASVEP